MTGEKNRIQYVGNSQYLYQFFSSNVEFFINRKNTLFFVSKHFFLLRLLPNFGLIIIFLNSYFVRISNHIQSFKGKKLWYKISTIPTYQHEEDLIIHYFLTRMLYIHPRTITGRDFTTLQSPHEKNYFCFFLNE